MFASMAFLLSLRREKTLFPHDLYQDPAAAIELAVEDLLPGTEIQNLGAWVPGSAGHLLWFRIIGFESTLEYDGSEVNWCCRRRIP